jgi:hypothetical protein
MGPKPLPALLAAMATSLLLMTGGCGPGVGGTGTGEGLTAFGATAASVCDSTFADKLACGPAVPTAPADGTRAVTYIDTAGQLVLRIDGNRASFDAACLRLQFSGDFGLAPGNAAGFFGTYRLNASAAQSFAGLLVQRADSGGDLRIELRDIDGRTLVAPVILQAAPTPLPAPAPC